MKITLESTPVLQTWQNVQCRVWQGKTDGGVPVYALIPRLAVPIEADQAEFERELKAQPHTAPLAIDIRMIL